MSLYQRILDVRAAGLTFAATGHQHYHLTTQPDQTSRWERRD